MKIVFGFAGNLGFKYRSGDSDYFALAGFVYSDDADLYDHNFNPHPSRIVASIIHKRLVNSRDLRANPQRLLNLAISRAIDERGLDHAKLYFPITLRPFLPDRPAHSFRDEFDFASFLASDTAADLISAFTPFTQEINESPKKNYITKVNWPLA